MRPPATPDASVAPGDATPARRAWAAAWLVTLGGIGAAVAWVLTRPEPLALGGDNETLHHPLFTDVLRQLRAGHVPVWTTGRWGGSPLLGDPVLGAMHPLNYVGYLLTDAPHARAIDVAACLHLTLLVAGVVWLMRGFGVQPGVAVATATLVALDPTLVYVGRSWVNWHGTIACWPWLLGATVRLARVPRRADALVATTALAVQIYAGYPQLALYFGLVALGALVAAGGPGRARSVALAATIGLGAIGLAAPQLVPGLATAGGSVRLAPGGVDRLAALDVVAIPVAGWARVVGAAPDLATLPGKLAPAALVLAAIGTFGGRPVAPWLAAVAVVAAVLATGPNPLHALLHTVPPFSFFGGPLKFFYVTAFLVPVLAGLGLDAIGAGRSRLRRVALVAVALAAAPALGLAGTVAGLLAALLPSRALGAGALALAVAAGGAFFVRTDALGTPQPFGRDAFTPLLRRPATDFASPTAGDRWLALDGSGPLRQVGMNFGALWGVESWSGVGPLPSWRQFAVLEAAEPERAGALARMLGATRVVARAGGAVDRRLVDAGFRPGATVDGLRVLSSPDAAPARFLLAERARAASPDEALVAARRGDALEGAIPIESPVAGGDDWTGDATGTVAVVEQAPAAYRLDVAVTRPTWLVAREPFDSRWVATVDGSRVDVRPAGGLFTAIRIPAGRHAVGFRYVEPGLRTGILIALVTLVLLGPLLGRETRSAARTSA